MSFQKEFYDSFRRIFVEVSAASTGLEGFRVLLGEFRGGF